MNRTHNNGELRISDVNKIVELKGWVAKKRNLGSLVFIDLRDRYGITQIVLSESMEALAKDIKNEYVIHVVGKVIERSSKNLICQLVRLKSKLVKSILLIQLM